MKVTVLASYAYLRDQPDDLIRRLVADPRIEFLVDSGAFTAFNSGKEIVLAEYMAWLHKWKQHLFGYMALDKLQDPVQTDANLAVMLADGLKPIPIHVYGDDGPRMDWLFEQSEWVACGGLRRPHRGAAPDEYVKQKMKWAAGRRVHWLGYTDQSMIKGFRPFSADCASMRAGGMYGQMHVYLGGGEMFQVVREVFASRANVRGVSHRVIRQVVASSGFDPHEFDRDSAWRAVGGVQPLNQLNMRSWIRYAMDMRASIGTRLFLASISHTVEIDAGDILSAVDFADRAGWLNQKAISATGGEP